MAPAKNQLPLFAGFKAVTKAEWEEKIKSDLKGRDPALLFTPTREQIPIAPFYTPEDIAQLPHCQTLPGKFPFIRGHKTGTNSWQNLVAVPVGTNSRAAIDQACQGLAAGADGIHFKIETAAAFDLDYLLSQLDLTRVPVAYSLAGQADLFFGNLLGELKKRHQSAHGLKGFIQAHPDRSPSIAYATANQLEQLVEQSKEAVDFYGITVQGAQFGNQGATAVQEIAFTLSLAVFYTNQLASRGIPLSTIFRNLQVTVSSGTHYFMEIAKLRALRWLWAGLVKAFAEEPALGAYLRIHATTSSWTHTTFEPHSNLLRATTEAMSAILGGCDSITVAPFDETFNPGNAFSARIARNIPLILKHEAYLDQVLDPAAGSYYLESLTLQLAEKAWTLFQQTEARGGFAAALSAGFIQEQVSSSARATFQDLASGQQVLVGTNKFINQQEKPDFDVEVLLQNPDFDNTRASYPFEVMRLATLLHYKKKKVRPKVLIALVGQQTQDHLHAAFAREFFTCGGFDIEERHFALTEQALEQLLVTECRIIVFAGPQSDFVRFSEHVFHAHKDHQNRPDLILAAEPQQLQQELKSKGFDAYIFRNCDATQIVRRIQEKILKDGYA